MEEYFNPYQQGSMWTRDFTFLVMSNFFLYVAIYILLPVLPLWYHEGWGASYSEAAAVTASFALGMWIPGLVNNYLVDTFRRKNVCLLSLLLLGVSVALMPTAESMLVMLVLRLMQGAFFQIVVMSTGATLVIDLAPSFHRDSSGSAFGWASKIGMSFGVLVALLMLTYLDLEGDYYVKVSLCLLVLSLLMILPLKVKFHAPLDSPLLSLDRFFLPSAIIKGVMLALSAFILGALLAHVAEPWFFAAILIGVLAGLAVSFSPLQYRGKAIMAALGDFILILGLVFLLTPYNILTYFLGSFLVSAGVSISSDVVCCCMASDADHCERGTANNTGRLFWEAGLLGGLMFEFFWTTDSMSDSIYWVCLAASGFVVLLRRLCKK